MKNLNNLKGVITRNESFAGKDLMTQLRERMDNKQVDVPNKQPMYTERKDGVVPESNPKSCKWDLRQEATSTITAAKIARREAFDLSGKRGNEKGSIAPTSGTEGNNGGEK